jgi:peptidylprolyl isomerase
MSRLYSIIAAFVGLFMAGALAAQVPTEPLPERRTAPPPPALTADDTWNLDLSSGGRVVIQLRPDVTPAHVERIKTLTRQGFYNGLAFFRVIEGFMAQGGDPNNNGTGGSTLPDIPAEINGLIHVRGAVAMARAESLNSGNSQFYIMFTPRLNMDRGYTVFGRVVGGMNFIDAIERGEPPATPTRIVRASLGSENVPPMTAEQLRAAALQMAQTPAAAGAPRGTASGPQVPPPPAGPRRLEPVRGAQARPPR